MSFWSKWINYSSTQNYEWGGNQSKENDTVQIHLKKLTGELNAYTWGKN